MIDVTDLLPDVCHVGHKLVSRPRALDRRPLFQDAAWLAVRERLAHVALLEIEHRVDYNHPICRGWLRLYLKFGYPEDLDYATQAIAAACAPVTVTTEDKDNAA